MRGKPGATSFLTQAGTPYAFYPDEEGLELGHSSLDGKEFNPTVFVMRGIERMMEQAFEAGRIVGRTVDGSTSECPYEERLAPNLRNNWIYGFLCGRTGRAYRKLLRLI